jgi:hypothetical protein
MVASGDDEYATHDGAWAYGQLQIVAHSNTRACGNAPLAWSG